MALSSAGPSGAAGGAGVPAQSPRTVFQQPRSGLDLKDFPESIMHSVDVVQKMTDDAKWVAPLIGEVIAKIEPCEPDQMLIDLNAEPSYQEGGKFGPLTAAGLAVRITFPAYASRNYYNEYVGAKQLQHAHAQKHIKEYWYSIDIQHKVKELNSFIAKTLPPIEARTCADQPRMLTHTVAV
jgi:hypothetical protein